MRKGFISMSRLLIVGVVIALILAGCGGDWKARPGQTVTVKGPEAPSTTPANSATSTYSDHTGLAPALGGTCPAGFPVKGVITRVGVQNEQVFLTPDSPNYASTQAFKCFKSAEDAQSSQFMPLK